MAWAPKSWRIRYRSPAANSNQDPYLYTQLHKVYYKGIPYKTEWLEYPDIEGKLKELGISLTSIKQDGQPFYPLPAIFDPNTSTGIADSYSIARYLDKTYLV